MDNITTTHTIIEVAITEEMSNHHTEEENSIIILEAVDTTTIIIPTTTAMIIVETIQTNIKEKTEEMSSHPLTSVANNEKCLIVK